MLQWRVYTFFYKKLFYKKLARVLAFLGQSQPSSFHRSHLAHETGQRNCTLQPWNYSHRSILFNQSICSAPSTNHTSSRGWQGVQDPPEETTPRPQRKINRFTVHWSWSRLCFSYEKLFLSILSIPSFNFMTAQLFCIRGLVINAMEATRWDCPHIFLRWGWGISHLIAFGPRA